MDDSSYKNPRISTEYTYKGIEMAILENRYLRVEVLTGKGGDIISFRDKRSDIDPLWRSPHNWVPPTELSIPKGGSTSWTDHYPGGWQVNLPVAGEGMMIEGADYGLHGESALVPFSSAIARDDAEAVELELTADLVRYPFRIERTLSLQADEPKLHLDETVTNLGEVPLEFIWQHHIALGPPLVGPGAHLDIPAASGLVDDYSRGGYENSRLQSESAFKWPHAPGKDGETIDLRTFPPYDAEVNDMAYATDLDDGWYAITNPELDFGFGVTFPADLYESVWYWQPLGGETGSPFFGRNYNIGLEPTTAYPGHDVPERQRENGTIDTLRPGKSESAELTARTYCGVDPVEGFDFTDVISS